MFFLKNKNKKNQDKLSKKLESQNIPFEYVKESNCYIYIDPISDDLYKIYKKNNQTYTFEEKDYNLDEIFSFIYSINKKSKDIEYFKNDDFAEFWEMVDFLNPLLDQFSFFHKIEINREILEIKYITEFNTELKQIKENEKYEFIMDDMNKYQDCLSLTIRTFEKLYDNFDKENKKKLLDIIPKNSPYKYYINRYMISRKLIDEINFRDDTEAQIIDNNGTIFVMLENGCSMEYTPPCVEKQYNGHLNITNLNDDIKANQSDDYYYVIKILDLISLINEKSHF